MNARLISHWHELGIAEPTFPIPERDIRCSINLIDISPFYTEGLDDNIHHKPGNNLTDLPKGFQTIDGVDYDLRGIVQLAGANSKEITTLDYPRKIVGIEVGLKGRFVHFLHASAWNIDFDKTMIGTYKVCFEDGRIEVVPLMYKVNIWDWWSKTNDNATSPAWKGYNERTRALGEHIRLFHLHWRNPHPEVKILSIEVISTCLGPGIMVAGITIT